MNPLLEQFLIEARDFLQDIGDKLLALENNPDDQDLVNELFRLVHTLKGNSGLFDFPEMTRVLHASEDLLDAVRAGKITYTREMADLLLDAMDFVSMLCDEIENEETIKNDYAEQSSKLTNAIRELIGQEKDAEDNKQQADTTVSQDRESISKLIEIISAETLQKLKEAIKGKGQLYLITYKPADDCFYSGEDPFYLVRQTPGMLWCNIKAKKDWPKLDEMDAYSCNLYFEILTDAQKSDITEHYRYVIDQIEIAEIKENEFLNAIDSDEKESEPAKQTDTGLSDDMLEDILNTQKEILTLPVNVDWLEGRLKAVAKTIYSCCVYMNKKEHLNKLDEALEEAITQKDSSPLISYIDMLLTTSARETTREESTEDVSVKIPYQQETEVRVKQSGGNGNGDATKAVAEEKKVEKKHDAGITSKILKVDQAKIDRLMNLIGEMVVSKNTLPYLANKAENVYGVRELSREIKSHYNVINRIVEEMQDAIMQVRMVPVSTVFRRFPRLVRDIANKLGKEVELVIEGEDTEADKNIIESLADPLIHIIRNSLDHGIEPPEERQNLGKPRKGKLVISAAQESDRVVIRISDDGKGIDPEKIKMKAYEKGIIDEAELERISDQEAINLIMLPGFSTADQISDLSGRGVGMDVVKTAVEKVKGEVNIESEKGKGTVITLSLPLSIAVTNVMIIQSDGQKFGIPMDMVVETVRVAQSNIFTIKDKKVTILRDHVVPLFNLNDLLGINKPQLLNEQGELAVIVVRTYTGNVGIVVDEFFETTDIILKPMEGILSGIKAYAGTALLGDGSVLIVLNPKEMV